MDSYAEMSTVLKRFGLGTEYQAVVLNKGTANKHYSVQGGGVSYILRRRSPKYSSEAWISFEDEYLRHASAHGLPVPVPVRAEDGQAYVRVGEEVYQLLPYMKGEEFRADDPGQRVEAGRFLGMLHKAMHCFAPQEHKALPRYDDPADIRKILDDVQLRFGEPEQPDTRRILTYVSAKVAEIAAEVPDSIYEAMPQVVIHGDYHPANVTYTQGRISGLFDFDWISKQPRLRDLLDCLIYFAAIRETDIEGGDIFSLTQGCTFDLDRCLAITDAYQQASSWSLGKEEIRALPYLMNARFINSRAQALRKIAPERTFEMLTVGIKLPLNWMDEHGKELVRRLGG